MKFANEHGQYNHEGIVLRNKIYKALRPFYKDATNEDCIELLSMSLSAIEMLQFARFCGIVPEEELT